MRTYPKRLLTILMVLAMLVSMMAVPAMATEANQSGTSDSTSITAVAKIGDTYYETFEAAIAAASADATITRIDVLCDYVQESVENTESYYDITGNLTIGADESVTVSGCGFAIRVKGENATLTIEKNVTIEGLDVVANGFATTGENMVISGNMKALSLKQWTNNGTITVTETGSVWLGYGDGQFDLAYGNGTVTITGTGDKSNPQFKAGYSGTRGNGNTLNLTNTYFEGGAWFTIAGSNGTFNVTNSLLKVSGGDGAGYLTMSSTGNVISLTNSSELNVSKLTIGENNTIQLDTSSKMTTDTISGAGKIIIDAANLSDEVQVIKGNMSGFNGTIEIINNDAAYYETTDSGVVVKKALAKVGTDVFDTLEDAIAAATDGQTVNLYKDVTVDSTINIERDLVIDGQGKYSVTFTCHTGFYPSAVNFTLQNITLKNGNMPHSGATHPQYVDTRSAANITFDNVTAEAGDQYAVNLRGLSSGANLTIKNSNIQGSNTVNVWGNDHTITIIDSTLTGTAVNECAFSVIAFMSGDTFTSNNNKLIVDGSSTLNSTAYSGVTGVCYPVHIPSADTNGVYISISDSTTIKTMDSVKDILVKNAVASFGNMHYNNLSDAIKAAEGKPVKLLKKDETLPEGYCFNATDSTGAKHTLETVAAVAPTCTENGIAAHFTCKHCGQLYKDAEGKTTTTAEELTVPTTGHKLTKVAAVAATCTTAGNTEYYTCANCKGLFTDAKGQTATTAEKVVVPATGHKLTPVEAKPATCTEDGVNAHYICQLCVKLFNDPKGLSEITLQQATAKATGHKAVTGVAGKLPTCTEPGNIEYVECSCGALFTDEECKNPVKLADTVVAATGHKLTKVAAVAVTCNANGNTEYYTCETCKALFADAEGKTGTTAEKVVITATGHALTKVEAKAATCTTAGNTEYYTCVNCKALFADAEGKTATTAEKVVVAATGHKLTKVDAVAATCTTAGNTEYYTCANCKALFADAEGKTATTAEKVVVAATGHKLTKTAAVAATCTTAGNTEYYTCANCKALFADAEGKTATTAEKVVVAATGHKLTKVEAVAPTYTAAGNIEHYACACGALFADAEGKTATTAEAVKLAQLIEIKESTAEVSTDAVDTAIKEAETTGSITIDLVEVAESETTTPDSGSDSTTPDSGSDTTTKPAPVVSSAALPVASLEKVAEISEEATLTVNMTEVTVTMDAKAMAAVAEQSAAETVTLKVEKVETKTLTEEQQAVIEDKEVAIVVTATMISNNVAISDFKGGEVTIALPFTLPEGTEGSDFQVYYVADDGTMTAHETEYKNGCLVFSTTHFSDYVVVNTAAPADPTVPNTGDSANLLLSATAFTVALTGLAVLFIGKKKFSF